MRDAFAARELEALPLASISVYLPLRRLHKDRPQGDAAESQG